MTRRSSPETATRDRLLEAALEVFARLGYHGATVADIVAASGSSKGAFYHYFPSKQGIFLELLRSLSDMVEAGVEGAIAQERGGLAKVEAALAVVLGAVSSQRSLARILLIEAAALGPEFEEGRLAIHRRFAALIKRHLDRAVAEGAIPAQDTETAATAWIGAVNEILTQRLAAGGELMPLLPPVRALLLRSIGAGARGDGDPALAAGARLRERALEAAGRARGLGRPVLAWVCLPVPAADPVFLFERLRSALGEAALWYQPREPFSLVAGGRAWSPQAAGPPRFEQASLAWRALAEESVGGAPEGWGTGPVLFGGFAFAPDLAPGESPAAASWRQFGTASMVLPDIAVACAGDSSLLTLSVLVDEQGRAMRGGFDLTTPSGANAWVRSCMDLVGGAAAEDPQGPRRDSQGVGRRHRSPFACAVEELPTASAWMEAVASAARAVADGELEKVVLARALRVQGAIPAAAEMLGRLAAVHPGCTLYAVSRGEACFLGATPERLVRLRRGRVSADALAGSAPRGSTPEEDRRLGELLLSNPKDRLEHALVVEEVRRALMGSCDSVSVGGEPVLLRTANVQHLHTPIAGTLRGSLTAVDLAGALHPTPAVGGVPVAAALEWIDRHESVPRGWYAGPLGWVDLNGDGEFAVALRCALAGPGEALLYAGCGIMADSEPEDEYEESALKLRAMLAAIGLAGQERTAGK